MSFSARGSSPRLQKKGAAFVSSPVTSYVTERKEAMQSGTDMVSCKIDRIDGTLLNHGVIATRILYNIF